MIVIVLSACPAGLRGDLNKWLLEVSAGVFVGTASSRVRELLWERVVESAKDGRAIMAYSSRNEQRMAFRVHRNEWSPVDLEGVNLIMRPAKRKSGSRQGELRRGWSNARRYRRGSQK